MKVAYQSVNLQINMTFMKINLMALIIFYSFYFSAQTILITNATIHNGKGDAPYQANVLIKNAVIAKIDVNEMKENADTIIRADALHLYPAFISCNNVLGLQEAEAIRPTSDYKDMGDFNPHLRTLTSYNTDSKILPTVFSNGVLYTQCTPRGDYIAGTSAVIKTKARNWEDAVITEDGIHFYMPSEYVQKGWWAEPDKTDKNKEFHQQLMSVKRFLSQSKIYFISQDSTEFNPRYEAMKQIWKGEKNFYIHCNRSKDIMNAIQLAQELQIPKVVLVGCEEIYKVIDIVKKYQYPVILSRINGLPPSGDDKIKINFELPGWLEKNNILYAISISGDMEAMQSRNLPFVAGMSVSYGLSKEKALQSITLNAAKILGVDKQIGSIENGKTAALILSTGDALDPSTHQIKYIILEGKIYSDKNFQMDLYQKYLDKYNIKN